MRFINYAAAITVLAFATACGGNSTKETETSSVDTANVTTNGPVTTTPVTSITVPDTIRSTFQEKYPTVQNATWSRYQPTNNIDWEWTGWPSMDTSDYAVNFRDNDLDSWAWYDDQNNWVGSVSKVTDYNGLPEAVNKVIRRDFDGYTISEVDKEHDRKRTAYEIDLTKGDDKARLLIDENGVVIKKKMKIDGERTKEKM